MNRRGGARRAASAGATLALAGAMATASGVSAVPPGHTRLPGSSGPSWDPPTAFRHEKPLQEPAPEFRLRRGLSSAVPGFRNPGFESAAPDGSPADWVKFREAYRDTDPALAHTGAASVRSSFLMGWFQDVAVPCDPFQTFAVTGRAAREVDFEEARVRIVFSDVGGAALSEVRADSPIDGPARPAMTAPPGWGRFHATAAVPEAGATARVFLAGRGSQSWIRYDDLEIATENLPPEATSAPLSLAPGGGAGWNVVSGRSGESYFVTGFVAVPAAAELGVAATTLTVTESALPRSAASDDGPMVTRSVDVTLTAGATAWFTADVPRPAGSASGSGLGRVTLSLAGVGSPSARIGITSPSRGFAKVEPGTLTVGTATPDLPLRLTAAWPDCLASATVTLLESTGAVLATPAVTLHGTSARAQWTPPPGTPAGPAVARFDLTDIAGRTVRVERPFALRNETTGLAVPPPFKRATFTRCAWVFGRYLETTASLDQAVRLAREDGFESAHMILRFDQFAAGRAAAEREGMDYFVQSDEATALLRAAAARDTFSGDAYVTATRDLYAPFAGSPRWMGVYVADEPSGATLLDRCRRAFLALAQDTAAGGGLGVGFCTFPGGLTPAEIAGTAPAIVLADIYPFHTSTPVSDSDAVLDLLPLWRGHAAGAAAGGRHLWAVVQGFESIDGPELFRAAPPAAHAAQLASVVLAGAKGVVPFTHTAISFIEGLRGPDGEPTPKLAAYREFNAAMDRVGPTLMDLNTPVEVPAVPRPWAASVAVGPGGAGATRWLMVLNADSVSTRTLAIPLTPPPPQGTALGDAVNQTTTTVDSLGRVRLTRGPGGWAMLPLPAGVTVDSDSGGTGGPITEPAPPETPEPAAPQIALPVLWQAVARASDGRAVPAARVSLAPGGGAVAVGLELFDVANAPSRVFRPDPAAGPGGAAIEDPAPGVFPADIRAFMPDGRLFSASPYLGFRVTGGASAAGPATAGWLGHSGGARAVAGRGDDWWATMDAYDLRHLTDTAAGGPGGGGAPETTLATYPLGRSDDGAACTDLFGPTGPMTDPAVLLVVRDRAAEGATSATAAEAARARARVTRADAGAALSPDGRTLAIPRHARGVTLVAIGPDHRPDPAATPRDLSVAATDTVGCAWLADDLLAVADITGGIHFHRPAGGAQLGRWTTPANPADAGTRRIPYVRSIAAAASRVAIGLQDGRILAVNVACVAENAADMSWVLYH